MKKILVITGSTATGKTKLGIKLAKKFNGEIISADSRQVYKGNDIETGKDRSYFQWGVDLVEPGSDFNVSDFVKYATKIIKDVQKRGKLPIIVGGSGQYIKELLNPSETLNIPPNKKLRKKLAKYSVAELQKRIKIKMNPSDWKNPRRLIRAIEIQNSKFKIQNFKLKIKSFDSLLIGLTAPRKVIYEKISERRADRPNLIEKEFKYAKKQMIYMKKFLNPLWFDITDSKIHNEILWRVREFTQPAISKKKDTLTI